VTARVSRTQAWCKLAVLIADGAPSPCSVHFVDDSGIISVAVDSMAAFHAWVGLLGAERRGNGYAYGPWQGWSVQLDLFLPKTPEPELIAEDMASVRAVAAAVSR
jgi:hypothetical protein